MITEIERQKAIGQRIRDRREYLNMSPHDFVAMLAKNGLKKLYRWVSYIETGQYSITATQEEYIAVALRCTVGYLHGESTTESVDEAELLVLIRSASSETRRAALAAVRAIVQTAG